MQQSEKLEHLNVILKVLDDVSNNLSDAYKGLISDGLTPRSAKSICMIWAKAAFKDNLKLPKDYAANQENR